MNHGNGKEPLLVVGASARAAAQTAIRRGRAPMAIDLFGDVDLRDAVSHWRRVSLGDFPAGIATLARELPAAPFVATGGLENAPEIVAALEGERDNEGCDASAIARVRDPFRLARVLATAGIAHPRVLEPRAFARRNEPPNRWVLRPLCGCGGRGIVSPAPLTPPRPQSGFCVQERIDGVSCSAVFETTTGSGSERRLTRLLGMTRQLIGETSLAAGPFAYCGSVGPLAISSAGAERFRHLGEVVAHHFGLRGLFGIDAILAGDEPWPVEVNPRYTASVEVVEKLREGSRRDRYVGKAIVHAPAALVTPAAPLANVLHSVVHDVQGSASIADIPSPGTAIEPGRPILTVHAGADSSLECQRRLLVIARRVSRCLAPWSMVAERPGRRERLVSAGGGRDGHAAKERE